MSNNIGVKWIKIYTNMVSNKKIRRIRTLPEGNSIILIWVFLIAQAGESNKNGALYLTDTLPFTPEDLAVEFDFELSIIKFALITLEKYSMVEVFEDVIYIKNWGEYQNIDGLEKIQIQNRDRKRIERASKKLLLEEGKESRDSHATVTQCHATEIDIELEIEKEKETKVIKKTKPKVVKLLFGEKVHLSEVEHGKLVENNGEQDTSEMVSILDNYYLLHNKKPYASDYQTMVKNGWVFNKLNENKQKQGIKPTGKVKAPSKYDNFYL